MKGLSPSKLPLIKKKGQGDRLLNNLPLFPLDQGIRFVRESKRGEASLISLIPLSHKRELKKDEPPKSLGGLKGEKPL